MREIARTTAFKRDMKRMARSGRRQASELLETVRMLASDEPLAPAHRDHSLSGNWTGFRECHIQPDWLLIYRYEPGRLVLVRTGSHADLFG